MNWGQKSVSPTRATLIYAGEPVWAGIAGRLAGERLPGMPQTHITRDRQARRRLRQPGRVKPVLIQQRLRVMAVAADGLGQGIDKSDRKVTQTHRQRFHGLTATRSTSGHHRRCYWRWFYRRG